MIDASCLALLNCIFYRSIVVSTFELAEVIDGKKGQFGQLHKTEQRHAEKQVQVAADCAQQALYVVLGLLVDKCVGQRVVVNSELDKIVYQVEIKVCLIGVLTRELNHMLLPFQVFHVGLLSSQVSTLKHSC